MEFLPEMLTVTLLHLLALVSPGPDFALVFHHALTRSRRDAIWTSLGIASGIVVHVSYCLMGIGLLISQSILAFTLIKLCGAAYLIYLGIKCLRAKKRDHIPTLETVVKEKHPRHLWFSGFLTNVLNPKATLFIFSLFTQVINPHTPLAVQAVYGFNMVLITFLYFSLLSTLIGRKKIKNIFQRYTHRVEHVMGVVLIGLGLKIALGDK